MFYEIFILYIWEICPLWNIQFYFRRKFSIETFRKYSNGDKPIFFFTILKKIAQFCGNSHEPKQYLWLNKIKKFCGENIINLFCLLKIYKI